MMVLSIAHSTNQEQLTSKEIAKYLRHTYECTIAPLSLVLFESVNLLISAKLHHLIEQCNSIGNHSEGIGKLAPVINTILFFSTIGLMEAYK